MRAVEHPDFIVSFNVKGWSISAVPSLGMPALAHTPLLIDLGERFNTLKISCFPPVQWVSPFLILRRNVGLGWTTPPVKRLNSREHSRVSVYEQKDRFLE